MINKIKKLPTILALLILLSGVTVGVFLVRREIRQTLQASPEITPKQVKVTNITDKSFSVSWITDGAVAGSIRFGPDSEMGLTALDDRDAISGNTDNFTTHHISVKNLQPATKYSFKIISRDKEFDDNGQAYNLTTGPILKQPLPENDVAYGIILQADANPAEGAIVYLSLSNGVPQSTLTKNSGSWVIPLNTIRSDDLVSYLVYDPQASIENIFVQGAGSGMATAVTVTQNDNPTPNITLGQTYDFRQAPAEATPPPAADQPQDRFDTAGLPSPTTKQLQIDNPQESEVLNTLQPEFWGSGPVGETLTIEIHSPENTTTQVAINQNGYWYWSPPQDLTPGKHTITISLPNGESISRLFTVLAADAGEPPAFTSTPSATLTPTATPIASGTATPTPIVPTATPTTARTSMPSTDSGVPDSGVLTPTFVFSIMGIILIAAGIFFNVFLKKQTYV